MSLMQDSVEQALAAESPRQALRELMVARVAQGESREALLAGLESDCLELRAQEREADEEALMDVMDCLAGFCSPQMRI